MKYLELQIKKTLPYKTLGNVKEISLVIYTNEIEYQFISVLNGSKLTLIKDNG